MKTKDKVIEDPMACDPKVLLGLIEQDPESFTIGRRNDDLVNWYIAKRLGEPDALTKTDRQYAEEFDNLKRKLTIAQRNDLRDWSFDRMTSERKISQLWRAYRGLCKANLQDVWIPMCYRVPALNMAPML